jgi:UDP-N-acetylglucosamine transferase subunit ALG13
VIFVTVGTQEPFDRLVGAVDAWAAQRGRTDVFAQIGTGARPPEHIEWVAKLSPAEFQARLEAARVVVSHAGMGTILSASSLAKPIVVLPRLARFREHRNDHQLATVKRLAPTGILVAARDEAELAALLDRSDEFASGHQVRPYASDELIARIRGFLLGAPRAEHAHQSASE